MFESLGATEFGRPAAESRVVATYARVHAEELADLAFAHRVRQLLVAVDSPYAFHRVAALCQLFRTLRELPPPRTHDHDPAAALAREAVSGRDAAASSAPSLVAHVLKRAFRSDATRAFPAAAPVPGSNSDTFPPPSQSQLSPLGPPSGGSPTSPVPPPAAAAAAAAARTVDAPAGLQEKELALRVCQGACAVSPGQRKLAEESRIVDAVNLVLAELPAMADALEAIDATAAAAAATAAASPAGTASASANASSLLGPGGGSRPPSRIAGMRTPSLPASPVLGAARSSNRLGGTQTPPRSPTPLSPAANAARQPTAQYLGDSAADTASASSNAPAAAATTAAGGGKGLTSGNSSPDRPVHRRRATSVSSASGAAPTPQQQPLGPELRAQYRVVIAALDALEAALHYAPALVVKAIKRGAFRRIVACVADQRHPDVVREAAADALGSVLAQTFNPVEWPDRTCATALHNEVKASLRAVLDARRAAGLDDPTKELTANQLLEALVRLRDFRGLVAFTEVSAGASATTAFGGPRGSIGPAGGGARHPPPSTPASPAVGSRGVASAQQQALTPANARMIQVAQTKEMQSAVLRLRTARRTRFDAFLRAAAAPDGARSLLAGLPM